MNPAPSITPKRRAEKCPVCRVGNQLPQGEYCDNLDCGRYYKRAMSVGEAAPEDSRIVGLLRMHAAEKARADNAEADLKAATERIAVLERERSSWLQNGSARTAGGQQEAGNCDSHNLLQRS